ncbi:GNAT family N-acetyltransferase [Leucobacter sp. PH1c]|uniref:GNAT family N-acetyltransferase n=1 Tax=Leucobacter sp. PH1c TaxID=1397278 RepID=UPI0004690FBC|nr:GNAT family N-acetyltransferase [Leucobacter sp. PH1c]
MSGETARDSRPEFTVRALVASDIDETARILAAGFWDDPVWGPAFPEHPDRLAHALAHWRFMAEQAVRFGEPLVAELPDGRIAAVSTWFPPGEDEVNEADLPAYAALLRGTIGDAAAEALLAEGELFAEARPDEPHAYLSMLAVAPEARGLGIGMRLVAAALERYDAAGLQTYLESSNPGNDARYERLGYLPARRIEIPGSPTVQSYLRPAPPA